MGNLLEQKLQETGWNIVNQTPLPVVCFTHPKHNAQTLSLLLKRLYSEQKVWISEVILKKKILLFSPTDVNVNLNYVLQKIKKKYDANKIRKLYLHIDQDVVDPTISGASLCQAPNGISDEELFSIIKFVIISRGESNNPRLTSKTTSTSY